MHDIIRPLARGAFGLAVLAALGFGTSQVAASPVDSVARSCQYGPCPADGDCSSLCLSLYPENGGIGHCRQGCCICAE